MSESDQPQLPGYNVDDDPHDDNDDAHHVDVVKPERLDEPVVLSANAGDAAAAASSTATVSSPARQDSTQSSSTPPYQQEAEEEHPTAITSVDAATPTLPPRPVDEFADPKISGLHAIFPDYDATIL